MAKSHYGRERAQLLPKLNLERSFMMVITRLVNRRSRLSTWLPVNRRLSTAARASTTFAVDGEWFAADCTIHMPTDRRLTGGNIALQADEFAAYRLSQLGGHIPRAVHGDARIYQVPDKRRCVGAVSESILSPCGQAPAQGLAVQLRHAWALPTIIEYSSRAIRRSP
jgi:hypothetical protein